MTLGVVVWVRMMAGGVSSPEHTLHTCQHPDLDDLASGEVDGVGWAVEGDGAVGAGGNGADKSITRAVGDGGIGGGGELRIEGDPGEYCRQECDHDENSRPSHSLRFQRGAYPEN